MRDKNKLKKMLALLAVGAIVLTPVVGVFAFGTQKTNSDNNSDNQNHSLDEILVKTDLGTFAYNATDQAILSRLLTLNDAGDSSVGSGLILNGNVVSGTIAVDGKTYSGSIDITYTKNSAPELYKDLALLFDDTNLGTVDYNKVDLNNLDEVSKWAKDHLDSKNHFSNLVLENEISNIISKITFATPSINEDGSGTITASVSDETPIQLNGRNYSGTVTLVFKTTHLKIKDISVIQDDLSNLLNDSTMTTTEWTTSNLLAKKLGGTSEYKDKTLSELGIEITSSSHSDLVSTKDYIFAAKEDSKYFIKDSTVTITHKLDVSVVSNVIIAALDDVAKNGSGSDIPAITDPESWWTEWDEYLNSSNSHLLADKIKPDGWEHGLNYYGFGIYAYTDDNDQHYLEIKLNSDGNDLGFNASSDDDENSYILWSFTLPSVDNISVIQEELTSLVNKENDKAWDLTELQSEKLGGTSDNKDKTLSELGITVTLVTDDKLSGTNSEDKTEKLTFKANGMSYSGSIDIEHNYTETTFTKDNISVIQDDLSNLLNDSTMTTTEWTIDDLLAKKLGGDSEYKDKTLSELGIDISQADHNDSELDKNNENVSNVQDYTFTAKESSEYFTKDTSTTITHNLDISVVVDKIKSWLDEAAWGEKTSAGINGVTDPDNWFSWASSNTSTLQNKTMSDDWTHGLNSYGFKVSTSKDADNNDCLKITFESDDKKLGFNASSDDDENSYILWSFSLPSVDNISVIQEELTSLVNKEKDKAWDLTELQSEKLGGDSNNKDKTLSELGITVTEADALSGTNNVDKTEKLTFMANGMSYSGSQEIDHNYTKTTFTKDDISVIQDDLSNLLNDSTMTTTEWTISDLLDKKLGGDSEYKDKTLSELGIDISQADHNGSEKHKNNDENVSNVQDYTFTAKESSDYFTKDTSTTITHNLDISVVADEIKSWIDAAAYGEKTSAGIDAVTDPDNWFSWASSNTSKLQEKTMSDVWNHALQKYGFTVSKSKDADGNDCLKITFDSDDYDLGFNASSDDDENSYILWSFSLPSVDNISVIQEELTSLVNEENDKAWDLTELQGEKLGGTSDNKDKTLSELGITVTLVTDDKLSGTNSEDKTEKLTFKANGMSYSGSIDIEHNYTETTFTKDNISVIQDDLQSILDSKQDEIWTADELKKQTLGGTTEYKDKTLSELGIDVEASNDNVQILDDHVTNSYKFIADSNSEYFVADSNVSLSQDIGIVITDSVYIDYSTSVIKIDTSIPDDTKEILYLGIDSDSSSYTSIPDNVEKVTLGKNGDVVKFSELFYNKGQLKYVDVSNADTSNVTDMSRMFKGCLLLETIDGLDKLDTSKVENMYQLFAYCQNIESLDLSNFDTSNVTDMSWMFMNCKKIKTLDLSSFDTSKVTTIDLMFEGCVSLENITGIENWDMSSLTTYISAFAAYDNDNESSLECPDLSGWIVSKNFDQSKFVGASSDVFYSTSIKKLKDFDISKAPVKNSDISFIQDDLSNLVNDSTMLTSEWDINDLKNHKLGGNSKYKDKTLSELGIDISQADHNDEDGKKVVDTKDYTFTIKSDSKCFTEDQSVTITHKLNISVLSNAITTVLDNIAENGHGDIPAITDPESWWTEWEQYLSSSDSHSLGDVTAPDGWDHGLNYYGFKLYAYTDEDGQHYIKIKLVSDDEDLGFNLSSDDDANSYILWSYSSSSI